MKREEFRRMVEYYKGFELKRLRGSLSEEQKRALLMDSRDAGTASKLEEEQDLVFGLRLTEVRIDKHTVRGNMSRLECKFDLQGESLYSVKWYKDGHEFYRFLPRDTPPGQVFPLNGVRVVQDESNESQVTIGPLELSSSGRYRCEVSAEAPSFQTVSDHGDMLTVALPEEGPRISGGKPRYQVGDKVKVNCTSGPSKPPAQLSWYINGEPAKDSYLRGPFEDMSRDGLVRTMLGLEFRIERRHFRKGDLKLKCLASIGTVYWNSNEESVEGERPQRPPALEVKDTKPHLSSAGNFIDVKWVMSLVCGIQVLFALRFFMMR